jgi:lipopolysaccharide biosynthesis glycosyltransferase
VCDNICVKTTIVTSFDKNYLMPSMVFMKSLSDNYDGAKPLSVVCLVPQDVLPMVSWYRDVLNVSNLNIEFRCSDKFLGMLESGNAHESGYISSHCNHRIFLGSVLPDFDKAIYIDPDTIILRSISPLLMYPMRNKLLAALEYSSMNVKSFYDFDRPYFNNGVFIADLNYWRDSGAEDRMNQFTKDNGPTLCPEQDAMNYAFIDVWSPLPFSFNSFHTYMESMEHLAKENDNPVIVHFVGPSKPWINKFRNTKWERAWHECYAKIFGEELL